MDLFNLAAKITLDTTEYERGLTGAQSKWNSMGSFIKGGAGKIAKVGGVALAAASGAVVAFGKKSIDAGMAFDSSMSQVAATMGLTMADLQSDVKTTDTAFGTFTGNLREYAQFMGKNTAFSATEAADALNYMALAGYDTQTSMDMLPNVLNLAAAGSMDLAQASDMVTDAQTALGLDIGETTELVDKMAKTSSKSNTSVSQLGEAMLTVGGTAKNMKGGTTELSAALGVLADNGIKGAEGGTALRNVLLGIQSKKFEKTFGELGVSAYDADGNLRPLNETLADMNTAMEGMTEQEKTKLITNTFNKADLKSVNALLGTSAERWDELTGEIENASGAAQDMADTQLDNLAGDVTLFKSALEGAQIAISDSLNPTLRNLVQEGTSGLQRLTDAFTEGGFNAAIDVAADLIAEWTQKLVEGIPKVLEIGAKLLLALAKGIIKAVPSVLKGLGTLGGQLVDAIRRGMAKGVGFGPEGDYKISAFSAVLMKMAECRSGATGFIEDYTYDLTEGEELELASHMLEVPPSFAASKPEIQVHHLGIGGKDDPARLVFDGVTGDGIQVTLVDMGDHFRIICADIELVKQPKPMPKLPVARIMYRHKPDFAIGTAAWCYAGGAHHSVVSTALTRADIAMFARLTGTELITIGDDTTEADLQKFFMR